MADQLAKLDVQVNSLAKPIPRDLLAARTAIRVTPELQQIFESARTNGVTADELADALYVKLGAYLFEPESLWDTCKYLADEFFQLGDRILLISRDTGQAIASVTEDDIYVPQPVARETGKLAQPLPRLRPDLEGAIVQWQFQTAKDAQTLEILAKRTTQTALLVQEGDPRLLRATANGRKKIVKMLKDELADLWNQQQGAASEFLRAIRIIPPGAPVGVDTSGWTTLETATRARVITPVVDMLASNLQHDTYTALKRQIGGQWVRGVAGHLSDIAHTWSLTEASVHDSLPESFWVADAVELKALGGRLGLVVPHVKPTLVRSDIQGIYLCLHDNPYEIQSREFLGRWEVAADVKYTIYVNPEAVLPYRLHDVPEDDPLAEVVR